MVTFNKMKELFNNLKLTHARFFALKCTGTGVMLVVTQDLI